MKLPRAIASVNGKKSPLEDATIPILDRGFLFGDAVYEVIRVYQGRLWRGGEHFQRLRNSLQAARTSDIDMDGLANQVLDTIRVGAFTEAIAYIQITRGTAPRKHAFPQDTPPNVVYFVQEFADPYVEQRARGAAVLTQPDLRWQRCDIKSTNLLANVLAMQAAVEAGCIEAILYRPDGTLTEGTHTSFFGVRDGVLLTTPTSPAISPGITRQLVLQLSERTRIPVCEHSLTRDDLPRVSELFLTGTTTEVLPIVRVDDLRIGDGTPGPITRRLQQAYRDDIREFLAH
jgi:D-alanine transaminase